MPTHIPIYVEGDALFVDGSWYSDLLLARDFLAPEFGPIAVLGPSLPLSEAHESNLHRLGPEDEDIELHPSVDARTRVRRWWPEGARRWRSDVHALLLRARVLQASVDDPFRPMQLAGLRAAFEANKPAVVVGFDMDVWSTLGPALAHSKPVDKAMAVVRAPLMDGWMRYSVRRAPLSLLKQGTVFDRYGAWARNAKAFCHSMHVEADLIDDPSFEARIGSLSTGRPLVFGYFGRFIPRKGLADALAILAAARAQGLDAQLRLTGWGPQLQQLQARADELQIREHVHFLPGVPYGPELHARVRELDALLFTPTEEDTPRMVYDALAAGLPLITTDVPFLKTRADHDGASTIFGVGDVEAGARALLSLDRDRDRLAELSRTARAAGRLHTVEHWYGLRRDWTLEAVEAAST